VVQPWTASSSPGRPVQTSGPGDHRRIFLPPEYLSSCEPGAGKTTRCSSWCGIWRPGPESATRTGTWCWPVTGRAHRALGDWLVEEMNLRYQVPKPARPGLAAPAGWCCWLDGWTSAGRSAACGGPQSMRCVGTCPPAWRNQRVAEYSALAERCAALGNLPPALTPAQIDAISPGGADWTNSGRHADGQALRRSPKPADVERDDDGLAGRAGGRCKRARPPRSSSGAGSCSTPTCRRLASQGAKEGGG